MIAGRHIVLCGFMGSGKSTHGRRLARLLGRPFTDLDKEIEAAAGQSINAIFAEKGEEAFREMEAAWLKKCLIGSTPAVISLGGGTPCFYDNLQAILVHGLLVYVRMDEKSLYRRLTRSKTDRPLLRDKPDEELKRYIHDLLTLREPYYRQAHITVNGVSLKTADLLQQIHLYNSLHHY